MGRAAANRAARDSPPGQGSWSRVSASDRMAWGSVPANGLGDSPRQDWGTDPAKIRKQKWRESLPVTHGEGLAPLLEHPDFSIKMSVPYHIRPHEINPPPLKETCRELYLSFFRLYSMVIGCARRTRTPSQTALYCTTTALSKSRNHAFTSEVIQAENPSRP